MSKVSILIPVYNQQDFVADAIQSALDQTIPCEIIIINDGSTDNSLEVARRFKGIKIVDQINKGLSSARNAGIMNATGEYVFPLDADDILLDNCIEKLLDKAEETNADIIAPSIKTFGVQNGETILMPNPTIEDFKVANRIPYCSLVKRSALLEVGGYSPRMWFGYEDYSLWINMLRIGKTVVTVPEVLALYRTKESSMYTEALKHHDQLIAQIVHDNKSIYA